MDTLNLITTAKLVEVLQVSRVTLLRWRKVHIMPVVKITGYKRDGIRFRITAIRKWALKKGKNMVVKKLDKEFPLEVKHARPRRSGISSSVKQRRAAKSVRANTRSVK